MQTTALLETMEKEGNDIQQRLTNSPYFILIERAKNKKVRIPCANEEVAKRILASFKLLNLET